MTKPFDCAEMQVTVNIEAPTLELALMQRNMGQSKVFHFDDAGDLVEILTIVLGLVPVIVSQDERLLPVEARGDRKPPLAETEITQVPYGVFLADRGIPPTNELVIVLLEARELFAGLLLSDSNNAFVIEMRICNEKRLRSYHQYAA